MKYEYKKTPLFILLCLLLLDLSFNPDCLRSGSNPTIPLLLILGYTNGVQIWVVQVGFLARREAQACFYVFFMFIQGQWRGGAGVVFTSGSSQMFGVSSSTRSWYVYVPLNFEQYRTLFR